jgi:acetyl esterase
MTSTGIETFFRAASAIGRLHPLSRPERHGVEVLRDIPYLTSGSKAHLLDVYSPRRSEVPRPVVLYVHGGGFRILSKETHWVFGLSFARKGYLVFLINYRLAPRHPFPAPLEDVCHAYRWVLSNAARFGGDPSRIVVAGESAGANLVTSLTLATTFERPEPFAREVYDLGVVPSAVWPACGILQVSDPERFWRERAMRQVVKDRILAVCRGYLHGAEGRDLFFADPLVVLESEAQPQRPLPPFFLSAGMRDPIRDDTRRLEAALRKRGVRCEARYDDGQPHAYQALLWKKAAREVWRDTFRFLDQHVPVRA